MPLTICGVSFVQCEVLATTLVDNKGLTASAPYSQVKQVLEGIAGVIRVEDGKAFVLSPYRKRLFQVRLSVIASLW